MSYTTIKAGRDLLKKITAEIVYIRPKLTTTEVKIKIKPIDCVLIGSELKKTIHELIVYGGYAKIEIKCGISIYCDPDTAINIISAIRNLKKDPADYNKLDLEVFRINVVIKSLQK